MIRIKHTASLGGSTFQRVAANELLLPGIYFPSLDETTISRTTLGDPTGFSVTLDGFGLKTDRSFLNGGTVEGMTVKASGSILGGTLTGMDMAATALQTAIGAVQSASGTIADLVAAVWGGERFNVTGHGGKDVVEGGAKADKIATRGGNDLIIATGGRDAIDGGQGRDTLAYENIGVRIVADLGAGTVKIGNKVQTVTGIEVLAATNQADKLTGGSGDDTIFGLDGADTIIGLSGRDRLFGEDGRDVIRGGAGVDMLFGGNHRDFIYGGSKGDVIKGQAGYDLLYGGVGNDRILGGKGKDWLEGQSGDDTLTGGADTDQFVFVDKENHAGAPIKFLGNDVITDFSAGDEILSTGSTVGDVSLSQVGADAVIAYNGGSITLNGVDETQLVLRDTGFGLDITLAIV